MPFDRARIVRIAVVAVVSVGLAWVFLFTCHFNLVRRIAFAQFLETRSTKCHNTWFDFITNGIRIGMTSEDVKDLLVDQGNCEDCARYRREDGVVEVYCYRSVRADVSILPFVPLSYLAVTERTTVQFENNKAVALKYQLHVGRDFYDCNVDLKSRRLDRAIRFPAGALCPF